MTTEAERQENVPVASTCLCLLTILRVLCQEASHIKSGPRGDPSEAEIGDHHSLRQFLRVCLSSHHSYGGNALQRNGKKHHKRTNPAENRIRYKIGEYTVADQWQDPDSKSCCSPRKPGAHRIRTAADKRFPRPSDNQTPAIGLSSALSVSVNPTNSAGALSGKSQSVKVSVIAATQGPLAKPRIIRSMRMIFSKSSGARQRRSRRSHHRLGHSR